MKHLHKYLMAVPCFTILLVATIMIQSCRKDDNPPVVSEKSDARYNLPQGNAAFDQTILDFYKKYDTYILYKFSTVDFNYQFSYNLASPPVGPLSAVEGPVVMRGADAIAMAACLDFMEQYWFGFYPDAFKKRYLPQKILLAGLTYKTRMNATTKIYDTPRVNPITVPIEGADHLTLPKIDTAFLTLPLADKLLLKAQLNKTFLKQLMYPSVSTMPSKIMAPEDFFKISDYLVTGLTATTRYKSGFLINNGTKPPTPFNDLSSFLDTICGKSKAQLDAYALNPVNDQLGLVKRKYELLINFFKNNYNVDLQAIGNKQN